MTLTVMRSPFLAACQSLLIRRAVHGVRTVLIKLSRFQARRSLDRGASSSCDSGAASSSILHIPDFGTTASCPSLAGLRLLIGGRWKSINRGGATLASRKLGCLLRALHRMTFHRFLIGCTTPAETEGDGK